MELHDFGGDFAQTYIESCKNCGRTIEVSTQRDENPQYITDVYVRCICGESVVFYLPVN